jgi:hypothetical protein
MGRRGRHYTGWGGTGRQYKGREEEEDSIRWGGRGRQYKG